MEQLPDELLLQIFGFLSVANLNAVSNACRRWRRLVTSRDFLHRFARHVVRKQLPTGTLTASMFLSVLDGPLRLTSKDSGEELASIEYANNAPVGTYMLTLPSGAVVYNIKIGLDFYVRKVLVFYPHLDVTATLYYSDSRPVGYDLIRRGCLVMDYQQIGLDGIRSVKEWLENPHDYEDISSVYGFDLLPSGGNHRCRFQLPGDVHFTLQCDENTKQFHTHRPEWKHRAALAVRLWKEAWQDLDFDQIHHDVLPESIYQAHLQLLLF